MNAPDRTAAQTPKIPAIKEGAIAAMETRDLFNKK